MAVELTGTSANFVGSGVLSSYTPLFSARTADQVHVYVNGLLKTYGDDYTLLGLGDVDGISVQATFPLNAAVYVERLTSITQEVDTQNNETILEDVLDGEFDKLTMIDQEQQTQIDRAPKVPKGEAGFDLPAIAARAGKFLAFDAGGQGVASFGTGADLGLRSDLASVLAGAALIAYILTGAVGAQAQTLATVLDEIVTVTRFGADRTGVADSTAAFNKAIAWAITRGGKVTIMVPDGTYKVGKLNQITVDHVCFRGCSPHSAVLNLTTLADYTFYWKNCFGGGLRDLRVVYTTNPTAATVAVLEGTNAMEFDVRAENVNTFVQIGVVGNFSSDTRIRLHGWAFNGGKPLIKHVGGYGVFISDCAISTFGVGAPVSNRVSTMTSLAGQNFFECINGTIDTLVIRNCILERWYSVGVFATSGAGEIIQNIYADSSNICDYIRGDCWSFTAAAGTGGIFGAQIYGYATSWEGHAFMILANGVVDSVVWHDPIGPYAGKCNLSITGPNHRFCGVDGKGQLEAANRINAGFPSVRVTGGSSPIVRGVTAGRDGSYGGNFWQPPYGVELGADILFAEIVGVNGAGTTGGFNISANTTPTAGRIYGNTGNPNYSGFQAFALPASATPYVEKSSFRKTFYTSGGTGVAIVLNGNNIGAASSVDVDSGDSITWFYTAAPTVAMQVHP